MTAESDSNRSKEPKNRGEVYKQEQQRIAEESHQAGKIIFPYNYLKL
jgi:hypothetical protein